MIYKESTLKVMDNSGARIIKCIDTLSKKKYQTYGTIIKGVITHLR